MFAIEALRDALEEVSFACELLSCNVSAASEWIIRYGQQLYKKLLDEQQLPIEKRMNIRKECGSLYHGPPCLSRERWQFWKRGFSEVTDEVDEATAKMALEAESAMERIEKDMEQRRLKRQANQTVENGMTKRRLKQRPLSLNVPKDGYILCNLANEEDAWLRMPLYVFVLNID